MSGKPRNLALGDLLPVQATDRVPIGESPGWCRSYGAIPISKAPHLFHDPRSPRVHPRCNRRWRRPRLHLHLSVSCRWGFLLLHLPRSNFSARNIHVFEPYDDGEVTAYWARRERHPVVRPKKGPSDYWRCKRSKTQQGPQQTSRSQSPASSLLGILIEFLGYSIFSSVGSVSLTSTDRGNIGNSKVLNEETGDDLLQQTNMTADGYALTVTLFSLAYTLFEVPSNYVMKHYVRPSLWLAFLLFAWGALTMGFAGVQNYATVVVLRFLIGAFEAGFFPGMSSL